MLNLLKLYTDIKIPDLLTVHKGAIFWVNFLWVEFIFKNHPPQSSSHSWQSKTFKCLSQIYIHISQNLEDNEFILKLELASSNLTEPCVNH